MEKFVSRGPRVFCGYYKDNVQTRKVIDGDGWLYSGDIGLWLPGGRLKIIDESYLWEKGAYIAQYNQEMVKPVVVASDVEAGVMDAGVLSVCKGFLGIASVGAVCLVGELMVGDSLNSFQVDVVVVDLDILKEWVASEGVKYEHVGQLCNNPTAKLTVLSVEDAIGREAQVIGFEFAKAVTLIPKQLSLENGLLTPTFKGFLDLIQHCEMRAKLKLSRSDPTLQNV
ncbi:hypothetical protein G4B88_009410 [Cannabis sativa]|uniref:AMP-dependent synthetase/ligase domain-containing protein n=1 Tax=Cannabis sativa TaxID=3483 RepID=A0A7J6E8D5_CANSA|nr:hypothetical protein G4B88_009410 [Cannabis sativa]